jgi:hypothetical protein
VSGSPEAVNWRAWLIYTHRWLGVALGLLFTAWFVSGVAFMYWGMPLLSAGEVMDRQAIVDLSSAAFTPAEAARLNGVRPASLSIGMRGDRPVYVFGATVVYADSGERMPVHAAGADEAVEIVRGWVPEHAASIRYDRYLEDSDQWTLQSAQRRHMPVHRIAVGDARRTYYYVAERSGELIMKTDRAGRIKGFMSGVLHWIYFVPLRKHGAVWNQFIIWSAFVGALMCVLGLVLGVWRLSMTARFGRRRGQPSRSPYTGLMRWHHYFGLAFGVIAFTWVLSGAFSVNPFGMFAGGGLDQRQRDVLRGGAFDLSSLSLDSLKFAATLLVRETQAKEMSVEQLRGELYLSAARPPSASAPASDAGGSERRTLALAKPHGGFFTGFTHEEMEPLARALMGDVPVRDSTWLHDYDHYYRSRDRTRPLPVLRVRYLDDQATWLYLVPQTGDVVAHHRGSRARRWLYSALHHLDIPYLYDRRPLWDIVVIALSIGGIVVSASTLWPSVKRIGRHLRRATRYPAS